MAWAQNAPKLNARELFYSPPPAPAANPPAPSTSGQTATTSSKPSTTTASTTSKKQTTAKNSSGGTGAGTSSSSNPQTSNTQKSPVETGNAGNETIVAAVGQPNPAGQSGNDQIHTVAASAPNGPLGLRYAVLKRDPAGAYHEIDPDTTFRTGDAIRLQVETNTSGYLYVVTQGTSGQWQLLFPRPDVASGSNHVDGHTKLEVPGHNGQWKFDEHAGTEKLFLLLARQPQPDLDKLIYTIGGANSGGPALVAQATIRDEVVSHLRQQMLSRDLVFEKVDEGTSDAAPVKNENAAYVVNVSNAPDARVVKDFALQHR